MSTFRKAVLSLLGGLLALSLAGCAETTLKLAAAQSPGDVVVRYAQGDALMLSGGQKGAVALIPLTYDRSGYLRFHVGGYNHLGQPINFGPDDVSIRLDDGTPRPVLEYDVVRRHNEVVAAQKQVAATVTLAAVLYGSSRVHHSSTRSQINDLALDQYQTAMSSIAEELAVRTRQANALLRTTTIDPGAYWAGVIAAPRPDFSASPVHRLEVVVRLAGEGHRFSLRVAQGGTPFSPQADLPAASTTDSSRALTDTAATWLWTAPPRPRSGRGGGLPGGGQRPDLSLSLQT